jgi:hypothetical protein
MEMPKEVAEGKNSFRDNITDPHPISLWRSEKRPCYGTWPKKSVVAVEFANCCLHVFQRKPSAVDQSAVVNCAPAQGTRLAKPGWCGSSVKSSVGLDGTY